MREKSIDNTGVGNANFKKRGDEKEPRESFEQISRS